MNDEVQYSEQQAGETLRSRSLTALVDTTNSCNLRCRMCWFSDESHVNRPPVHMPVEIFENVAQQVFPWAHTVYLSAATEPLMHPQFHEILSIAGGYQVSDIKFLTNAQMLNSRISEACIRHGVSEIHVSIDGATPETYEWIRRNASYERLIRNLEGLSEMKHRMASRRPVIQFNVTLMRRNIAELGELVRLAFRLGVERIACRHLVVFEGLGMEEESLVRDQTLANESVAQGLREAAALGIGVVQFPDFFTGWKNGAFAWDDTAVREASAPQAAVSISTEVAAVGGPLRRMQLYRWMWRQLPVHCRWQWQAPRLRAMQHQRGNCPIGRLDEPAEDAIPAQDGLLLAGWALHRAGIEQVVLCREPLQGELPQDANELGLIPLGAARRHNGTRPDVAAQWPDYPERHQAGWTFRLSRRLLPVTAEKIQLHAVGYGRDGRCALLGSRVLTPSDGGTHPGSLYCRKPFDFVYIDPSASIFPHPECRIGEPFGSLAGQGSFESVWHSEAFSALRRRIALMDPPLMCKACPDFINRCVDDPSYFVARPLL